MVDPIKAALREAAHEAARLSCFVGALDALHEAMPPTVHPEASEIERRATEALGETIRIVIECTEALAARLDRLASAAE